MEMDHRSDLYSLGVTFYHLMAGEPPFRAETALALAMKHVSDRPVDLAVHRPDLPPDLVRLIMKLMNKAPGDRYQSAGEMLRDLAKIRESLALHHDDRRRARSRRGGGDARRQVEIGGAGGLQGVGDLRPVRLGPQGRRGVVGRRPGGPPPALARPAVPGGGPDGRPGAGAVRRLAVPPGRPPGRRAPRSATVARPPGSPRGGARSPASPTPRRSIASPRSCPAGPTATRPGWRSRNISPTTGPGRRSPTPRSPASCSAGATATASKRSPRGSGRPALPRRTPRRHDRGRRRGARRRPREGPPVLRQQRLQRGRNPGRPGPGRLRPGDRASGSRTTGGGSKPPTRPGSAASWRRCRASWSPS